MLVANNASSGGWCRGSESRRAALKALVLLLSFCCAPWSAAQENYRQDIPGGAPFVCTPETVYALAQPAAPARGLLGATDRIAQIYAFNATTGQDTHLGDFDNQPTPNLADNLNGLMIDQKPGDDRLLYIAQVSGTVRLWAYANRAGFGWGWVHAEDFSSEDIPRGAFNQEGVGYLISGSRSPRVFRITRSADASLYSVAQVGVLVYNVAVEGESSGDVVFDNLNNGWVAVGKDIWKIEAADLAAASGPASRIPATRQDRPISATGGDTPLWSGIAFGPRGYLYLSHNQTATNRSYWVLDDQTNVVSQVGSALGNHEIRDMASCRFPPKPLDPPIITAQKTLAYVNGAAVAATPAPIVRPGDYLTYRIDISNSGGSAATLYRADVSESVPARTTARSSDPNLPGVANSFSCTSTPCRLQADSISIEANQTHPLYFIVQVDDPLDASVTRIRNAIAFSRLVDCIEADNDCDEETPVGPQVDVSKSAQPASGEVVVAGGTITYTVTVTVSRAALTADVVLTDTLRGLTFGAASPPTSALVCSGTQCTLPQGTAPGTYTASYTATVNAGVTGAVGNRIEPSGPDEPHCAAGACETEHPVGATSVRITKASNPASGSAVHRGDVITYTVTAEVSATTAAAVTLQETFNSGLTFRAIDAANTSPRFDCSAWPTCTLLAGTTAGTYALVYSATVNSQATRLVDNAVAVDGSPADNPVCVSCATEHPLVPEPVVQVDKSAQPASGTVVVAGETITYLVRVVVSQAPLTADVVLTDTLRGLTFGSASAPTSALVCSGAQCTLPQGTGPGTYTASYTATVDAGVTGTVGNIIAPSGPDNPQCRAGACETVHPVGSTSVRFNKRSDPPSDSRVSEGDVITYTVTAEVSATTAAAVTMQEALNPGLTFGALDATRTSPRFDCSAWPTCTLLAGTTAGTYTLVYTATVNAQAVDRVDNFVQVSGSTLDNPVCVVCATEHPVVRPDPAVLPSRVNVAKTSNPPAGTAVSLGGVVQYTITAQVQNAPLDAPLVLTDTPSRGLVLRDLPADCSVNAATVVCVLPSGTQPDTYTFNYSGTVTADAALSIDNTVVPTQSGGTGEPPVCDSCTTSHPVTSAPLLQIIKTPSVRQVRVGDLIRYTLIIESLTDMDVVDAVVVDTPPPGFTYVEGSFAIKDTDNAGAITGSNPIRIEGVDVQPEVTTAITYLMRVGAGVRIGTQVNQAVATTREGLTISAIATAEVVMVSDPLLQESLILGTVFDDRDGDGWQDSAALSGLHVQGGFAASAYLPNSTTLDRGDGPQSLPDASAPLLHGVDAGALAGRESTADDGDRHRIVIRQRLSEPAFTDDFVITNRQGVELRMDAAGRTTVTRNGEAGKGRSAADLEVERRVARSDDSYVVDYVIRNTGIDERGIPGVRIASVEGLLMETDPFGRFHLVGIDGGNTQRGRNFILKLDPSTVPLGAQITTDNPVVRRLTPGLPLRFDFGVRLPVQEIAPGRKDVELALGEVIFEPGSAHVRAAYRPVIGQIAAKVIEYRGGEVLIAANGGEVLAYERAVAVRTALLSQLTDDVARALTVSVRTDLDDADTRVLGLAQGETLLGTVLFDTDKSAIRPEFEPLLDRIAAALDALGGGVVAIVGHTDIRASHEYNVDLGMRRATSVYNALLQRLSPAVRNKVSVEATRDHRAPVDLRRKGEAR